ncbi:MAG: MliC family protein [Candidatus Paceibacterota bacterium]
MKIEWNKVTSLSRILAIIIYGGTFGFAFYLGQQCGELKAELKHAPIIPLSIPVQENNIINAVTFVCDNNKTINALFFSEKVELTLSDGRNMLLMQAISASGARYANTNESFVFWSKGDAAFIEEEDNMTYENCLVKPEE